VCPPIGVRARTGEPMRRSTTDDVEGMREDLAFWRDLGAGDDDNARDLLALFLTNTSTQISVIVSGLAAGRTNAVRLAAHTCVGSCSTCGLEKLTQLFRRLESEASDNRLDALADTVPLIVETFDQVRARLSRLLPVTAEPIEGRT
jgi:HPt (histidine-containing phosphotransfer) domain-containing protein